MIDNTISIVVKPSAAAENRGAFASAQQIDAYLQRKSEVAQDDHQAFKDYLSQKAQVAPPAKDELKDEPPPPSKFNRRNLLKVVAGTAVAGEAAAAGYAWMTSGSASD